MDTLHTVIRSISSESKSRRDHLSVFREFLAHLDHIKRKAPAINPPRRKTARRKSAKR